MGGHPHHLGDDVPRFAQHHPIPDRELFFPDKFLVVQGGPTDGRSRQFHRLEQAGRGEHPGPADVDLHAE